MSSRSASLFLGTATAIGGNPTLTGPGGTGVSLDDRKIKLAQRLYPLVESIFTESRYYRLRLPLDRFIGAAQRRLPEDQVVDYVVGMESLLAPDTERLETTFRFRLRGSALLPISIFGEVRERIQLLGDLYDQRSRVVHGDATSQDLAKWVPQAENVLRYLLLWYLADLQLRSDPKQVARQLDEQLASGGSAWANPAP